MNGLIYSWLQPGAEVLFGLASLAVIIVSVHVAVATAFSLRAMMRARALLHSEAFRDNELRVLADHMSADQIKPEEMELARRKIEDKIVALSERDRQFIEEGLRQRSKVGAEHYVKEMLGAA